MSTRGRWVSSDKCVWRQEFLTFFFSLQTLFVLSLESEDLFYWREDLLTDIIRGSTEDDSSSRTRTGDAHRAQ